MYTKLDLIYHLRNATDANHTLVCSLWYTNFKIQQNPEYANKQ